MIVGTATAVGCVGGRTDANAGWSTARIDSLNSVMPKLLREFTVPGAAIVLIDGSEVQWSSGFGVAWRGGPAVSPSTVFQGASLGKPVFAYLVASLARDRAWRLDDSLSGWAPAGSYPRESGSLTSAEMLSHTSGLAYDPRADRLTVDVENRASWNYSGAGYVLLQRAIEASEAVGLEALAHDQLFEPLGLHGTSFLKPSTSDMARGYGRDGEEPREIEWRAANAASSLYASATDYARFLIHASGLGSVAPELWQRLTTARVTVREDLGLKWGLGWAVEEAPSGAAVVFHWGSNPGFKSFAMVDQGRGLGLVILTNGDNGLELVERLVAIVDPNRHPLFEFYMLHPDD